MGVIKDYDAHIGSEKYVTLRDAKCQYYNVRKHENGCTMLEPRKLATPETISGRTLEGMDQTIRSFKTGEVSTSIK